MRLGLDYMTGGTMTVLGCWPLKGLSKPAPARLPSARMQAVVPEQIWQRPEVGGDSGHRFANPGFQCRTDRTEVDLECPHQHRELLRTRMARQLKKNRRDAGFGQFADCTADRACVHRCWGELARPTMEEELLRADRGSPTRLCIHGEHVALQVLASVADLGNAVETVPKRGGNWMPVDMLTNQRMSGLVGGLLEQPRESRHSGQIGAMV